MPSFDPGTGSVFIDVSAGTSVEIDEAVAAARMALRGAWTTMAPADRGKILRRVADILRRDANWIGTVETIDSGKPLKDGIAEANAAAAYFDYYAGAADKIEGDTIPQPGDVVSVTLREPIGVSAQILPSNFPIGTAARGIAPALAAGCTVVAKPSDHTPMTALILADVFDEAGLPPGVYNAVTGRGDEAGAALATHAGIDQITFTGSLATGRRILAAAAANVVPAAVELGGKSPLVVLADANLDAAAVVAAKHMFTHAGQVCSAPSLLILERDIADALLGKLIARVGALKVDHGLRDAHLGAIASAGQIAHIERMVADARKAGAELLAGGTRPEISGCPGGLYYAPTILAASGADQPIVREEIFGPVLTVLIAKDADDAFTLADAGQYGLCASVFTNDLGRAFEFQRRVSAGQIYVNDWHLGGVQAPFGGMKRSGIGRERGIAGLEKYLRLKNVNIRPRALQP
jgi:aldehyde dehydrogenase (NAD+)